MKSRGIKVIKRDALPDPPPALGPAELLAQQQKDEAVENRGMADTVKDWIDERRENDRIEDAEANRRFES
jgi:hypothetical protein